MMAIQCNFMTCSHKPREKWRHLPPTSAFSTRALPNYVWFPCNYSISDQRCRLRRSAPSVVAGENATGLTSSSTSDFTLTYLEGNSWLWEVDGVKLLVDPILVGNLDFGIPWLYDAAKRFLKNYQLSDLPEVDCLLITQSLEDHCHLKTLKPLSAKNPNLRVIATPNAKALLDPLFTNVTYLEPGESTEITGRNGSKVKAQATAGPVLGPPWQRPENGFVVSMKNGDLESKGLLASIVRGEGTIESFKELLSKELPGTRVLEPVPGTPLEIPLA